MISHQGNIIEIKDNNVKIKIIQQEACKSCSASALCVGEGKERIIDAKMPDNIDLKLGDTVNVIISEEAGLLSVLFAYVIPFILIIISLTVSYVLKFSELTAIMIIFLSLIIYFIILYFSKNKLDKKLKISISK